MLPRVFLPALLLLASTAHAGVVFEFEVTDTSAPDDPPDVINTVVEGDNIRMDVKGPRGANADMIFRGGEQAMLAVDHDQGIYVRVDQTTIADIGEKLEALDAQLREAMKNAPPEQRAMLEEALSKREAGAAEDVEIVATGERDEVNGYPAVKFRLVQAGVHQKDIWVTDWGNVEGGREAAGAFEGLAEFVRKLQDAMPDFAKSPAVGSNAYEHLDTLDGFPVVTIDYAPDGSVLGENRLTSSRIEPVAATEFEPPADYELLSIVPELGAQ